MTASPARNPGCSDPTEASPAWRLAEAGDPRLLALYRAASPEAKLGVVGRLNATLISLKDAYLGRTHPEWSPDRRRAELRRWWLGVPD